MELHVSPNVNGTDAVVCRNVCKSFTVRRNTTQVLQGLNMTVPRGTIYGLLGPSGCGKTTLLRCIMGRCNPKEGFVLVYGHVPGSKASGIPGSTVGYMPQDIALLNEMTVKETMLFYGRVAGMSTKQIVTRRKFLMKLLNVPNSSNYVDKLSGGQKRRVSFAVALLAEPSLLILDEPTVGVDPLLRKRIWNYLSTLVQTSNTTVVITTHYVEEARQSDNVGLMLEGKLLAEEAPDVLMERFSCITLEDVFLKLCLVNDTETENVSKNDPDTAAMLHSVAIAGSATNGRVKDQLALCSDDTSSESPVQSDSKDQEIPAHVALVDKSVKLSSVAMLNKPVYVPPKSRQLTWPIELPKMNCIYAVFWKNLLSVSRHPGSFIMEFILPPLIMTVFGLSVGRALYGLHIGIVNEDRGEFGKIFADCIDTYTIEKVYFNTYDEAFLASREGHTWGVLSINSNFTDSIINRFLHGSLVNNLSVQEGSIYSTLDTSNQQVSFVINTELFYSFGRFARIVLTRMGLNPDMADMGIKAKDYVYGTDDVNFQQFFAPAFMSSIAFFMAMGLTALMIVVDRQEGRLEREFVSGIDAIELIIALLMSQMVVMCVQVALMLVVVLGIFQFTCAGSIFLISCLCLAEGLSGISLGLFISSICNEQTTAIVLSLAMWFICVLTNGIIWPIQGMPVYVRYISYTFPLTLSIEAKRNVMNRGWGLDNVEVWGGILGTLSWCLVCLMVTWSLARAKK